MNKDIVMELNYLDHDQNLLSSQKISPLSDSKKSSFSWFILKFGNILSKKSIEATFVMLGSLCQKELVSEVSEKIFLTSLARLSLKIFDEKSDNLQMYFATILNILNQEVGCSIDFEDFNQVEIFILNHLNWKIPHASLSTFLTKIVKNCRIELNQVFLEFPNQKSIFEEKITELSQLFLSNFTYPIDQILSVSYGVFDAVLECFFEDEETKEKIKNASIKKMQGKIDTFLSIEVKLKLIKAHQQRQVEKNDKDNEEGSDIRSLHKNYSTKSTNAYFSNLTICPINSEDIDMVRKAKSSKDIRVLINKTFAQGRCNYRNSKTAVISQVNFIKSGKL